MHVVVIGAGVFGAWTAHHLLAAGATVTLVDAYGPGNSRSSSGDETRILRCGYGPDAIYSEFAWRSLAQWRDLERRTHTTIWHPCGVLWMASADDPYFAATVDTLRRGNYPVELLPPDTLRERYAQLAPDPLMSALLEPECGVLMARRSVQALCAELEQRGGPIVREHVTQTDFLRFKADAYVFACGAWLGRLFPDLLGDRIRPTRQVVVYFKTYDERFQARHLPAWIAGTSVYGTPDIDGHGLKVGDHTHGPLMDPETDTRQPDLDSIDRARVWLAAHMPALADAPVVESRVCQYENTDTGDFLIDRHPDHDNVWIVGGGSGHGFKHGPAVGEYAARLVLTGARTEPRFALAGKTGAVRRAVY